MVPRAGSAQLEVDVACALIARVVAKIVALDGVGILFETVVERAVFEERLVAAEDGLPVFIDVLILVGGRIIAKENKDVSMTAIGHSGIGVGSKRLI